jgi:hypothetical protein
MKRWRGGFGGGGGGVDLRVGTVGVGAGGAAPGDGGRGMAGRGPAQPTQSPELNARPRAPPHARAAPAQGLDALSPRQLLGSYARPRRHEVAAALNRLRTLRVA